MTTAGTAAASPRTTWRVRAAATFRADWELVLLPVIVLVVVIPQYRWPIHYNEAIFVVFGRAILEGGLPYRDLVDLKPPLIYYFYALIQGLTGDGFMVTRVLIYLSLGLTSVLVDLTAREFYSRQQAFVGGLAFALSAGLMPIAPSAGLDQLMLLPLAVAIYAVFQWRRGSATRHLIRAGSAVGVAMLLKPTLLPIAAFLAGVVFVRSRSLLPPSVLTGAAVAVGGLVVLAAALIGVLPEAYDSIIVFGAEYAAGGWRGVDSARDVAFLYGVAVSPLLIPAGATLLVFAATRDTRLPLFGGLIGAAVISMALSGQFLAYYATVLLLPLALLIPGVLEWTGRRPFPQRVSVRALGVLAVALAAFVQFAAGGAMDFPDSPAGPIGRSISAAAAPSDRLWVRANFPQVYYYAGLRPAHRYFIAQGIRPNAERDAVSDLTATPPRFIVIEQGYDYPPLLALLRERYEVLAVEERGGVRLTAYRRLD
jgi:4-amino-4-deoxy-L-arabinose transferase-like glycosyltransferase